MSGARRILILVPHPDDEIVACCAALGRAQIQGAAFFALYLTHGCIAEETYVRRRRAEAEKVASFLNMTPVGWAQRPARHLWCDLDGVFAEIKDAVAAYGITELWAPAYEGGNADHDALNFLAGKTGLPVLEFAEYNFKDGRTQSQDFPFPNGTETSFLLTPEEQQKKRAALALYASEKQNLNYVKVVRETFRPLASYDYSQPPHVGTLWYARFQWVPFRHPRVDFTDPHEVCAQLTAWRGGG